MIAASSLWLELVRTGLALALVSALAFVALRLLARRGLLGVRPSETGPELRVLRRLTLGARSSVFVVAVGERTLVIGVGADGTPALLVDLGVPPSVPTTAGAQQPEPTLPTTERRDG